MQRIQIHANAHTLINTIEGYVKAVSLVLICYSHNSSTEFKVHRRPNQREKSAASTLSSQQTRLSWRNLSSCGFNCVCGIALLHATCCFPSVKWKKLLSEDVGQGVLQTQHTEERRMTLNTKKEDGRRDGERDMTPGRREGSISHLNSH